MDKEYYYLNGDTKTGPFSLDALKSAPINPDTLVWNSSLPDWVAARTLPKYNTNISQNANYSTTSGTFGNSNTTAPPMPENYLVWAILSTVLCCMPLGIVSIIYSTKVNSAYTAGDYAGAEKASKDAKKWAIWSAIVAGVLWVLYLIFIIIIGVGAAMSGDL